MERSTKRIKEAMDRMEIALFNLYWDSNPKAVENYEEAFLMSTKALGMQIPKEPTYKNAHETHKRPHCPSCGAWLFAWNFQSKHCNCGQALITGGSKMKNEDLKRNGSGYTDPMAFEAIKNVTEEEKKLAKTIKTIKSIAELAGYEVEERIVLKDKETGKIWR